jgi:hypothetical protein
MRPKQKYRFTKQEIMLRFFSFCERYRQYEGHLAKFLNAYMHRTQHVESSVIETKRELFKQTISFVDEAIFDKKSPPKLSLTVLEALLVGIGANMPAVLNTPHAMMKQHFEELTNHENFSEAALREGLSKKLRVIGRLDTAITIFAG